jgi:DNA-binding NarL/FixJ family response regulator
MEGSNHKMVLELLAEGCSIDEIAAKLYRSRSTIKNKLQQMYEETGAKTQASLVAVAFRKGWIK